MYARILLKKRYVLMFGKREYLNEILHIANVDDKGRLTMDVQISDEHVDAVQAYSSSFESLHRVPDAKDTSGFNLITQSEVRATLRRIDDAESAARQALANADDARTHLQKMLGIEP